MPGSPVRSKLPSAKGRCDGMEYILRDVGGHVEVYSAAGSFLFSADTTREAMEELAG